MTRRPLDLILWKDVVGNFGCAFSILYLARIIIPWVHSEPDDYDSND